MSYLFHLIWFIRELTQQRPLWKPLQVGKITFFIWTPKFRYFIHRTFTEILSWTNRIQFSFSNTDFPLEYLLILSYHLRRCLQIYSFLSGFFRQFLCAFAKLRKANISFVMYVLLYVRLNVTTRLSLDRLSSNLIFQYFSKICREYSSFIKI
jgi:hypothetical protein